jgi:hypothetical protein
LLLAPTEARAFCRTLTVRAPADYDPTSTGHCFDGKDENGNPGVPLFWRNSCISYNMTNPPSKLVSYEDASNAMSIAFTVWTGASCPTEGNGRSRASIDVRDLGPVNCGEVAYKSRTANQNVIVFRDDTWAYGPQVLGLTTVVFAPDTGEIFGADMEINTKDMEPVTFDDPVNGKAECSKGSCKGQAAYDFLAVVTHEAGHFLGVGHSNDKGSTMYARYNKGEIHQRVLTPDDVNAICTIYRPNGTRAVLDDKVTVAPVCDPTPRGGFTRECEDAPSGICATSATPGRGTGAALGWAAGLGLALCALRRARRWH